jgi:hypothetical protein
MKRIVFLIGISAAMLTACQNSSNPSANQGVETVAKRDTAVDLNKEKGEHEAHSDEGETAGKLVLDNGNKWQANAATTEGIQKMLTLVNEYLNKGDTDSKKLGERLDKEFTTILQECTMTGEAHEQLHNFLLPLKAKIEKLEETNSVEFVKEIQGYLNGYTQYFE